MDGQFEALRGNTNVIQIDLIVPSKDEHFPNTYRYIRITK